MPNSRFRKVVPLPTTTRIEKEEKKKQEKDVEKRDIDNKDTGVVDEEVEGSFVSIRGGGLRYCMAVVLTCKVDPTTIDHSESHVTLSSAASGASSSASDPPSSMHVRRDTVFVYGEDSAKEEKQEIPAASVVEKHMLVLRALLRAGLRVCLLRRSSERCAEKLVLLVSASGRRVSDGSAVDDRGLLSLEHRRNQRAEYVRSGVLLADVSDRDLFGTRLDGNETLRELGISPADEIALTESIVRTAFTSAIMHDFDDSNRHLLAIERVFPLHDKTFNRQILRQARAARFVTNYRRSNVDDDRNDNDDDDDDDDK